MTDEAIEDAFVEDFTAVFDAAMPRTPTRMLASLLATQKPFLSSRELASRLEVSAGSVSTSGRLLVERGFAVRTVDPETRRDLYRIADDMWERVHALEARRADPIMDLFDSTMKSLSPEHPAMDRLQDFRDFQVYHRKESQALVARYRATKQERT